MTARSAIGSRELLLRRLLVIGASAGMLLLLASLGRWLTFWYDEWNFVLDRQDPSIDTLLAPHVDHLSTIPVLIYQVLMRVFGLVSYWPWLAVLWACHFGSVGLLYRVTARLAGPWLAVIAALSLATLGPAFEDLLQAFQLSFLLSTLFGLLALERLTASVDLTRRHMVLAAAALSLATASSSVGVFYVGLVVAWGVLARRPTLIATAAPVVAGYALWYVAWRHAMAGPIGADPADPTAPVRSFFYGLGAAVTGIIGLPPYRFALLGLVVAIAVAIRLGFERLRPSSFGTAALLALVAMYALQAIFRSGLGVESAARSGYLYPAAIFIWLAAADTLRGRRLDPGRLTIGLVVLASTVVIAANLTQLVGSGRAMRGLRVNELAELRLISANRNVSGMSLNVSPDDELIPQVTAGRYLAAVTRFGEPRVADEPDPAELQTLLEPDRLNRAALLLFGEAFAGATAEASTPPADLTAGPSEIRSGPPGCVLVGESVQSLVRWDVYSGDGFSVSPPPPTLRLGVLPSQLAVAPPTLGTRTDGRWVLLPPRLTGDAQWFAEIETSAATTICRLDRA